MKILHVVALIHASTGGPAVSVTRLATEQARLGHEVTICTLAYPGLGPAVPAPGVRVVSVPGGTLAVHGRGWSPAFRAVVRSAAREADAVHNHGLWMWPNAYARQAAVAAGKPLLISPRGMLEPWARSRSRAKKAVAWWLFERSNLRQAAVIHATSDLEARSIRELGLPARVVVVPNGVDCPDFAATPPRAEIEARFPGIAGRRWVAFLSRIHPKKGLDILLQAWARARSDEGPVLIIAGPDHTDYRRVVERMILQARVADSVLLTGELGGAAKDALLAHADFFVLPSYSENFGMVVAEAMSWARPVITTTATPWTDLARDGAGWCVPPEAGALAAAMREALGLSPERLDAMGLAGRRFVESRFRWTDTAAKLAGVCAEVVEGAAAR